MDVRFVVVSPPSQQRAVAVRLPILVGRAEDAKFRIQQDSVSRRHCEFFVKDDTVFVRDLGSTNGTLLDDEAIAASVATRVAPGSIVRIGGVAFRVEYDSATVTQRERPAADDTVPMPADPVSSANDDTPAAAPDDGVGWPSGDEAAPPPAADDNLNDFFKSLS